MRRIAKEVRDFDSRISISTSEIVLALQQGIEIDLDQLNFDGGLLSYQGHQVLLYIPDQGVQLEEMVRTGDAHKGKRFHVADCETLDSMRTKGRFERYVVTNNLSGSFSLTGRDPDTWAPISATGRLLVCRNCLKLLNYNAYINSSKAVQAEIWRGFSISAFFEKFSSHFKSLPMDALARAEQHVYAPDWRHISERVRAERAWRCEQCRLDLVDHRHLLHVHHVNGIRGDNSPANLRVLCKDCHRKQPLHDHMFVTSEEMKALTRLRRTQSIKPDGWEQALALADLSIEGALQVARFRDWEAPVIGYELAGRDGRVLAEFEAAWPARRVALVVGEHVPVRAWQILRSVDFIRQYG